MAAAADLLRRKFQTFDEACSVVEDFMKRQHFPFIIGSRTTVEQFNRKIKGQRSKITEVDGQAVYSLRWVCKHSGQFKSRKQAEEGQGRNRAHFTRGCEFFIYVTLSKADLGYEVKKCHLEHSHDISPELYSLYPSNRQPEADQAQRAADMLAVGAKPVLVADILHKANLPVTTKDVYNMRQKLKSKGTPEEELLSVLRSNQLRYSIHKDDSGQVTCVSWTSSEQLHMLAAYGEVLMLDGTYKINKLRMPLYTLAVIDREGHGQPVAHALVTRESEDYISLFVGDVVTWNGNVRNSTFITDKDFAEINAIRRTCCDAKVFLCRFHIMKAFLEEMKRENVADNNELLQMLQTIVYSPSKDIYDAQVASLKDLYPRFHTYLEVHWQPHEELFAGFARRGVMLLDNHTNNRLERYHQTIKSVTGSSQVSLGVLIDRLHKLLAVRSLGAKHAAFTQNVMTLGVQLDSALKRYEPLVSKFALEKIQKEYTKARSLNREITRNTQGQYLLDGYELSPVSCSCSSYTNYRLPCRHLFHLRGEQNLPLFDTNMVATRWLISVTSVFGADLESDVAEHGQIVPSNIVAQHATASQRFKAFMSVLTPIASQLSELPPSKFESCMLWLGTLEQKVRDGSWVSELSSRQPVAELSTQLNMREPVRSTDDAQQSLLQEYADDIVEDAARNDSPSSDHGAVEADDILEDEARNDSPSSDHGAVEDGEVTEEHEREHFRLPIKVRQRGRPAKVRQRQFAKKNFRKAADGTNDNLPANRSPDSTCVECGMSDPPKSISKAKRVSWIQCDTCYFWYHVVCIENKPTESMERWDCIRCRQ